MQPNDKIKTAIESLNIPYSYRVFKIDKDHPAPNPPYITYFIGREQHTGSDQGNDIKCSYVVIEFYTITKDFALEETLEAKLDELFGVEVNKTEEYDYNENLFRITYEFTTTNKIRR
jgi:ABC-type microcin C transport system permease subunit YejE